MNINKFLISLSISALVLGTLVIPTFAGNVAQVYRFTNEPFVLDQTYLLGDRFPGPAEKFGEDVSVHYSAINAETVKYSTNGDVEWKLTQDGTATIKAVDDGALLYEGPFQVGEIVRDDGGDGGCSTNDGHAWLGNCLNLWDKVDFVQYNWKIPGVYAFNITIKGAGNWCYGGVHQDGAYGPGCN
jgi:hypothetical protein